MGVGSGSGLYQRWRSTGVCFFCTIYRDGSLRLTGLRISGCGRCCQGGKIEFVVCVCTTFWAANLSNEATDPYCNVESSLGLHGGPEVSLNCILPESRFPLKIMVISPGNVSRRGCNVAEYVPCMLYGLVPRNLIR